MKIFRYSIVIVAAMMTMACAKEIAPEVQGDGNLSGISRTFDASFEDNVTKAVLKPGAYVSKVEWETTDQVSVFDNTSNVLYKAAEAGESTKLTTEGTLAEADTYYALYPYNADATMAGGVITTTLPIEQTAVQGSFSTHLAVAQTSGTTFSFKNVGALIKVNVAVEGITEIVFRGNNDEYVAGAVKVTVAEEPTWAATTGYSRYVSLVAEEGKTLSVGDYYISVLPQTFSGGFSISAVHQDGTFATNYVTKEVVLERCDGIKGAFDANDTFAGSETNPYVLKTPEDLCSMYYLAIPEKEVYFELGNDINMEGVTDWIPVNYMGPFHKKTHFDGNNYTISNFTSPAQSYSSMFGVLYGSCKNVTFKDAVITGSSSNGCGVLGGYIGTTNLPAVVSNVKIDGATINAAAANCGGLGGQTVDSEFTDCSVKGLQVNSTFDYAGGLVGCAKGECSFSRCSVEGEVTGKQFVGGVLGQNQGIVTVSDCYTTCSVTGTSQQIGGIMGRTYSTGTSAIVERCWSSGDITALRDASGIVGSCITSTLTVEDCIAWNNTLKATNATNSHYFCGAIRGGCNTAATLTSKNCIRKSSLTINTAATSNIISDCEDEESVAGAANKAYHGKAAAEDATLSSVATSLGWSADVWDLTGDVPTLKAPVTE